MSKDNVPKCLKRKYTNTASIKVADMPSMCYVFIGQWYNDLKNKVPSCLTCKYKYTYTASVKVADMIKVKRGDG